MPGIVVAGVLEVKGASRAWRKCFMTTAWWTACAGLFINIFIVGYVILYASCLESSASSRQDCK